MPVEVKRGVYWVGAVDWGIRRFHGHELSTHRGTTYNAYLVRDEKTALVDTVWDPFAETLLANVREICDPSEVDFVVANHSEPDHGGSLQTVLRECPNATLVVSKNGREVVEGHHRQGWEPRVVSTGETIALGDEVELTFIEAPMLHWPDSMFTYVSGRATLLPNDAFGQHCATAYRFNDEVDRHELYEEALKYYANILTPYSPAVIRKIDELLEMDVPVEVIGPSHGVIWRDEPMQIVRAYRQWARQTGEPRAVVLYDTMWEATRRMAEAVGRGLADGGVDCKLFHMGVTDRNDALAEIFRSRGVVVGSPTLNNGLLPTIMPILEDLRGLRFRNKVGAAFGSYGWSGESVKLIEEHFDRCRIRRVADGVRAKWQPTADDLEACRALGGRVAEAVLEAEEA